MTAYYHIKLRKVIAVEKKKKKELGRYLRKHV